MTPLVILVKFLVQPDFVERFRDLIMVNARASLEQEPGCRRFDVHIEADEPRCFVLYEIYDSEVALDTHLRTQHYKTFAAAIETHIESRSITRLNLS